MNSGKTNQFNKLEYSVVTRHRSLFRCTTTVTFSENEPAFFQWREIEIWLMEGVQMYIPTSQLRPRQEDPSRRQTSTCLSVNMFEATTNGVTGPIIWLFLPLLSVLLLLHLPLLLFYPLASVRRRHSWNTVVAATLGDPSPTSSTTDAPTVSSKAADFAVYVVDPSFCVYC
jgi:hypothetical protein